jgi:hypothetical protein
MMAGCNRGLVLKTPLEPDEKVAKDDIVFVDGNPAGHVNKVVVEGQQRIAFFAINDESVAKEKMRVGVIRVRYGGKISLRTDRADAQAPMLANGDTVPVVSKTGFEVRRLASNKVVTVLLGSVAVIALALFCFRRLARGWLLLLTLVLSGWIAWVALPWASDAVATIYTHLPQAASVESGGPSQDVGAESIISRLMEKRPSPEMVAYAAVFIATFIVLSVVMRSSLNRLENRI